VLSRTFSMFLPDINFWLALTFESHCHHKASIAWFEERNDSQVAFCRITMLGFLRLAQNQSAFPNEAVTSLEAWSFYKSLLLDPRVSFLNEPAGIEDLLGHYFSSCPQSSAKHVTDTYLAAFAKLSTCALFTFDLALQQHPLLKS